MDLQITAEMMKISLNNCQIGYKKGKSNNPLNVPAKKKSKYEGDLGGKFECVLCGFQGKDKYKLARHMRTHSKSLQKHPCDICQYSFRSSEAVKKHVAFYHSAKAEEYTKHDSEVEIKVEDFERNTLQENEDPLGDEGEGEEKNVNEYQCGSCDKSFKSKKHLSRHEDTHAGVVHSCSQCSSTFSRRDKLNAHVRKKHQPVLTDTEENQREENSVESPVESSSANINNSNKEDLQIEDQEGVDFEELLDE